MEQVQVTVAHRPFGLDRDKVEHDLEDVLPDPLDDHFVVVSGRRYPPKQVIGLVTGVDRADFNTHQARRILSRLGFTVGRRSHSSATAAGEGPGPYGGRQAEAMRPFRGKWVALKGAEVLVAADAPQKVIRWLEEHDVWADGMVRVPEGNDDALWGAAPQ